MNKLLQRQLQKHFGRTDEVPGNLGKLLDAISDSYDHYEKDRRLIERSIDISSKEMIELNSQLKKDKADLKAYKELKTLFEDINEVSFSVDMIGYKLLEISAVCEKVYGYTREEFFSDNQIWRKVIYPEDKHISKLQVQTLRQGKQVLCEYRIVHKDGSIRWVENKVIPAFDMSGQLIQINGVTSDITQRKFHEELLQQSEINLAIKNKELERKNKELEQFAFVASHDLQEPLRTTSSFVELFQQQYKGKLDARGDKYLGYIGQASDRMKVLITDLLEYSRIGFNQELKQVDCNSIMKEVLAGLDIAIRETGGEIKIEQLPVIHGFQTEIKKLFRNLAFNSIKFRQKNVPPRITICAVKKTDSWQFAFSDNGIGIAKEHNERIFTIFQRLHTRNEYAGSGIGLSHCKKIVELHKGKIWLESELGKGTTFYFTIPQKTIPNETEIKLRTRHR
jgi:PAS domain S-box-containing protein